MDLNPLRLVARHTPQPIKGMAAMGGSMLDDTMNLVRHGIPPGDDLDAWDPDNRGRLHVPLINLPSRRM